jgi:alkylation response protein AidB-like acyl-CoA dehydrogenase
MKSFEALATTPERQEIRNAIRALCYKFDDSYWSEKDRTSFDNLEVPADRLIGERGKGFRCLLDSLNLERILNADEVIGIGRRALEKAAAYAKERVVFGRRIGQNQSIQHPLAECWAELHTAEMGLCFIAEKELGLPKSY